MTKNIILSFIFLVIVVLTGGCSVDVGGQDERDQMNAYARRAAARYEEGDSAGAIELYVKALEEDPGLARVHLDLALILHDAQKDYIGAIYHYRRYLDLQPQTQKKKMIENRIRLAGQSFAGTILGNQDGGNMPIIKELEEEKKLLQEKVDLLERKNDVLKDKLLQKQVLPASTGAGRDGSAANNVAAKGRRTYQVQASDTLQGISLLFYKDAGRWKDIYEKNKNIIKNPEELVVGQVLEIP